jgi:C-terminal processing protease CtpA/Prc
MSGIDVKALGSKLNHFVVSQIRKDSPAESADIQPNDEIVLINGRATRDMTLGEVNNYFRSKPGKKIKFELRRNNEKLVRKIRLERVI